MRTNALGIDAGTSGVRAAILSGDGAVLAFAATKYAVLGMDPAPRVGAVRWS